MYLKMIDFSFEKRKNFPFNPINAVPKLEKKFSMICFLVSHVSLPEFDTDAMLLSRKLPLRALFG
jgi:hypothetical protein